MSKKNLDWARDTIPPAVGARQSWTRLRSARVSRAPLQLDPVADRVFFARLSVDTSEWASISEVAAGTAASQLSEPRQVALVRILSELLTNAGAFAFGTDDIELAIAARDDSCEVEVRNAATEEHCRELERVVGRLTGESPIVVYEAAIRSSSWPRAERDGCGLARLRVEEGAELKLDLTQPGRVSVKAILR